MTTDRSPEARERMERDGCDCPPWIVRCAHFDGRVVALGYKRRWMAEHKPDCSLRMSITANMRLEEYHLCWPTAWVPCGDCGAPAMGATEESLNLAYFTEVDEALAAFEEAAAAMTFAPEPKGELAGDGL